MFQEPGSYDTWKLAWKLPRAVGAVPNAQKKHEVCHEAKDWESCRPLMWSGAVRDLDKIRFEGPLTGKRQ